MLRKYFLLIIFLQILINVYAQEVKVADKSSGLPIADVVIYSVGNSNSTQTDGSGSASLLGFDKDALLIFQHPSYHEFTIRLSDVALVKYKVLLDERIIEYEEVVVSASKWEQDPKEVPQKIVKISAADVQYSNPQTAADLLKNSGQVFVQKSQLGGGSPMIRGFAANRVLIVVDGVRMNNAIFRSGNLQNVISIDPNALESAEIVFGPGSVIYGSDALGGVMDFHTITPTLAKSDTLKVSATAMTRYSSANNERTAHANLSIGDKKLSLFAGGTYSKFGDLKTGSVFDDNYPLFGKRFSFVSRENNTDKILNNTNEYLLKPSGYVAWSAIGKLRYRPSNSLELQYSYYHANTSNIPRYDRLIQPKADGYRNAEWYYGPQRWDMHHLKAILYHATGWYDEAKVTTTYQRFGESRHDRKFGNTSLRNQIEKVDVFTFNIDLDKSLGNNSLYYGAEYTYNKVTSNAYRSDINTGVTTLTGSRYPDGGSSYNSFAGYASYQKRLNPKLTLNAGVRLSMVSLQGKSNNSLANKLGFGQFDIRNSALNGNLGLAYNPTNRTKYSLSLATGFRSPNIDDVGKVFELDDDIAIVPNPNLKPEYTYNAEIGLEHQHADWLKFGVVLYGTMLEKAILRGKVTSEGRSSVVVNGKTIYLRGQVNTGKAFIYGGSAHAEVQLPFHFSIRTTTTFIHGKDKTNNLPLRHTTPVFGQVSLIYENKKVKSSFFLEYNGSRFRGDIPPSEIDDKSFLYAKHAYDRNKDGSPGWYTLNFRTSYRISEIVTFTMALENIADHHYRPYASGISAAGRNFIFSILVKK